MRVERRRRLSLFVRTDLPDIATGSEDGVEIAVADDRTVGSGDLAVIAHVEAVLAKFCLLDRSGVKRGIDDFQVGFIVAKDWVAIGGITDFDIPASVRPVNLDHVSL